MNAPEHYHLVGVAGSGMSALAQALLAQGCSVSGSDRDMDLGKDLEVARKLKTAGVDCVPQDGSGVPAQTRGVVASSAVEDDNPDVLAAGRLGVPVIHRAEMLARLLEGKRSVAVTGTSGKSTVTGMIGWILEQVGADPTVVNGAPVLNWRNDAAIGNVRIQEGAPRHELWVIEADESDRSLLSFSPAWAVITNASKDHFEMKETTDLFEKFMLRATDGVVSPLVEPGMFRDFDPVLSAESSEFHRRGVAFRVPLPGRYNAENALLAALVCERLGFDLEGSAEALRSFRGLHRRMEKVGSVRGVTVIDDFAHNPAKIRAAWECAAPHYRRVIAVWQPHGFGPLAKMFDDLASVFSGVCGSSDMLCLLPVYYVGGTADRRVDADMLRQRVADAGRNVVLARDRTELAETIASAAQPGDVVLVMGARDPSLPGLAEKILARVAGQGKEPKR